jgi:hypothetical protein
LTATNDTHRPAAGKVLRWTFCLGLALLLCPATASAQELYNYTVSALAGVGGSPDSNSDDGLGNGSFQVGFSLVTEPGTHLGLRLGQLSFDENDLQGGLFDADLQYATVAGEYRFREDFYESGLFFGLGAYKLDGRDFLTGQNDDDTALGATLGVTGEFELTRHFGVLVELSGHYTDLDAFNFLLMGHAGLAVHFR